MKILNVISSTDPDSGGVIESVRQISLGLAEMGHHSEIVCLDAPQSPWLLESTLTTHALGPSRTGYRYNSALVPWLKANAPRFDAVLVHGLWQYGSFATRQALRGTATPYFVYPHGMLDPWFKKNYPLKHLKKRLYWPWAEYRVLRDARAVLFTCEEEKRLARQSFGRYNAVEKVVHFGIARPVIDMEAARSAFREAFPALTGKRLLLFLSRIHEKKGCDLLIEAFAAAAARDPALHLVMAGPDRDGLREPLGKRAQELGVGNKITWAGMLTGDLKWGAFATGEAFILPSHQENFGIAVVEALACGLPVLISNKINIWREIEADGAGLVAEDNQGGTNIMLQKWQALGAGECQKMRRAATECFAKRFDMALAPESLLRILGMKPEAVPLR